MYQKKLNILAPKFRTKLSAFGILTSSFLLLSFIAIVPVNASLVFSDEDDTLNPTRQLKRLKRIGLEKEENEPNESTANSMPRYTGGEFELKDLSDEEPEELGLGDYSFAPPPDMTDLIEMGTFVKLLANVYLRNLDQLANVFIPQYTYTVEDQDGNKETVTDYFRTRKSEICVFASGGLQNTWEKTVEHVYEVLSGQQEKIKIIRASWIGKYLFREKRKRLDLEELFKDREADLHSEYYYDIFFKEFFLPRLREERGRVTDLVIKGFSWWEVCSGCEGYLNNHQALLPNNCSLKYKVAATRRYSHDYPDTTTVWGYKVSETVEIEAWKRLWKGILPYAYIDFGSAKDKKRFWTKTKKGLELCKWLGQAFVENEVNLWERTREAGQRGDVLQHYQAMSEEETAVLRELMQYLRQVNWDLSCWYRGTYPHTIQPKWKKYWRKLVMPHFGWEYISEDEVEYGESHCEMCGNPNLKYLYQVFHPKYKVSNRFLSYSKQERHLREVDFLQGRKVQIRSLPAHLRKKRKQSLFVGSECVKVLEAQKGEVLEWLAKNPQEEREAKWRDQDDIHAAYDALDQAERELKEKRRLKREEAAAQKKKRRIKKKTTKK